MAKVDARKYVNNNGVLDNQSLIRMHKDGISPEDRYSAIYAYGTPQSGKVAPELERSMADYFSKNPIGNKIFGNVRQYGMNDADFFNSLNNRRTNYTYGIGPALQAQLNNYNNSSKNQGSAQPGKNPTLEQVNATQLGISDWNKRTQGPFETPSSQLGIRALNTDPNKRQPYGLNNQKVGYANFQAQQAAGAENLVNPGRPGGKRAVTADGIVGKKELKKFAKRKGIDAATAEMRLQAPGLNFTRGAMNLASKAMPLNIYGSSPYGSKKAERKEAQYLRIQDFNNMKSTMGKSDVYENVKGVGRLSNIYDVGRRPNAMSQSGFMDSVNPSTRPIGKIPDWKTNMSGGTAPTNTTTNQTNTGTPVQNTPAGPVPTASLPGYMGPGGDGFRGATRVGRAKNRLRLLGVPAGLGTSGNNRNSPFFNTINA